VKILWIHGWGTSPHVWDEVIALMPEVEHRKVSFAHCERPEDFVASVKRALLADSEQPQDRWTVVGWSMGGMVALEVLLREVELELELELELERLEENAVVASVECIVLIGSTLKFADRNRTLGWPPRVVERMRQRLAVEQDTTLREFRGLLFSRDELEKYGVELLAAKLGDTTDMTLQGLEAGLTYLIETDLIELWNQFIEASSEVKHSNADGKENGNDKSIHFSVRQIPVHWLHGSLDAVCSVDAVPIATTGDRMVLEGSGHALMITEPDRLVQLIRSLS
jgi:pimeloyl-[acyl-carrier protein] methyl ester esterase